MDVIFKRDRVVRLRVNPSSRCARYQRRSPVLPERLTVTEAGKGEIFDGGALVLGGVGGGAGTGKTFLQNLTSL